MRRTPIPRSFQDAPAERGLSALIGFVISFSIIVLAVGLLFTAGIGSLHDLQDGQQNENAEQVLFAIADGFQELQEGQAPKRAGSLDLDVGASLSVQNATTFDVVANGAGFGETIVTRTLEYRHDGTTLAYESGAIVRADRGGSVIRGRPPGIYCANDSNVAMVAVVSLVAPADPSISGGTVTVTGIQRSTRLLYPLDRSTTGVRNVTIDVTSPYESAWNAYFRSPETDWVETDEAGTFACEGVNRAFVRRTVIEVRIVD